MARDHRKLRVFAEADRLALRVYHASRELPAEERYGLQAQMWRAAISVPTNIVEGCARRSDNEYGRFIEIALSSAAETAYLLTVARRLGLLESRSCEELEADYEQLLKALNKLTGAIDSFE
jgi:four helix bundle protein